VSELGFCCHGYLLILRGDVEVAGLGPHSELVGWLGLGEGGHGVYHFGCPCEKLFFRDEGVLEKHREQLIHSLN
jgi:hypothetical protein